jgi:hypothetical protein
MVADFWGILYLAKGDTNYEASLFIIFFTLVFVPPYVTTKIRGAMSNNLLVDFRYLTSNMCFSGENFVSGGEARVSGDVERRDADPGRTCPLVPLKAQCHPIRGSRLSARGSQREPPPERSLEVQPR